MPYIYSYSLLLPCHSLQSLYVAYIGALSLIRAANNKKLGISSIQMSLCFQPSKKYLNLKKHTLVGQLSSTVSFRDPSFFHHLFHNSPGASTGMEAEGGFMFTYFAQDSSCFPKFRLSVIISPNIAFPQFSLSFLWKIFWTFSFHPQLLLNSHIFYLFTSLFYILDNFHRTIFQLKKFSLQPCPIYPLTHPLAF